MPDINREVKHLLINIESSYVDLRRIKYAGTLDADEHGDVSVREN